MAELNTCPECCGNGGNCPSCGGSGYKGTEDFITCQDCKAFFYFKSAQTGVIHDMPPEGNDYYYVKCPQCGKEIGI